MILKCDIPKSEFDDSIYNPVQIFQTEIYRQFNEQLDEYIIKKCVEVKVDPDALLKQQEEIIKLKNECKTEYEKGYNQGLKDYQNAFIKLFKGEKDD